jgi:DNA-binding transcriptional LysR family regulator
MLSQWNQYICDQFAKQERKGAHMDIEQLNYFIEVADCGSFSEAAARLFTTQSSVSKRIHALETELSVELFDRSRRQIQLTEAGTVALADARSLVKAYRQMMHSVEVYRQRSAQQLRIASIPVMAQYGLTGLVAQFSDCHSEINLSIREIEGIDIVQCLKKQEFDLAFMRTEHMDDSLACVPIVIDHLSVVLSADHPLAHYRQLSLRQLSGEAFLLLNQWTLLYDVCIHACEQAGFTPNVTYTGTRMETILSLIGRNQGISLMMDYAVSHAYQENIRIIPLQEEINSTIGLVYLKKRPLSDPASVFLEYIREQVSFAK